MSHSGFFLLPAYCQIPGTLGEESQSISRDLPVGVSFYIIDCLIVTYLAKLRLDLPWFERGIFAGGPAGILLTVAWLVFPVARRIFKRIDPDHANEPAKLIFLPATTRHRRSSNDCRKADGRDRR